MFLTPVVPTRSSSANLVPVQSKQILAIPLALLALHAHLLWPRGHFVLRCSREARCRTPISSRCILNPKDRMCSRRHRRQRTLRRLLQLLLQMWFDFPTKHSSNPAATVHRTRRRLRLEVWRHPQLCVRGSGRRRRFRFEFGGFCATRTVLCCCSSCCCSILALGGFDV